MKIWYPIEYDVAKHHSVFGYVSMCRIDTALLQSILRNKINKTRWISYDTRLSSCKAIHKTAENAVINSLDLANRYINSLQCYYDIGKGCCYYSIPLMIRCPNTIDSLDYVIRLIEYGNDEIPPMHWIRDSVEDFNTAVLEMNVE